MVKENHEFGYRWNTTLGQTKVKVEDVINANLR